MKKMAKVAAIVAAMELAAAFSACQKKASAEESGATGTKKAAQNATGKAEAAKPTPVNEFRRELTEDGSGVKILKYEGSAESVMIPSEIEGLPVKEIGRSAFYDCDSLKSVTIPDSVEEIGEGAFQDCSSLESVTLGNSVKTIGGWAFNRCKSLQSLTIPDSLQKIKFDNISEFRGTELPLAIKARLKALGYTDGF